VKAIRIEKTGGPEELRLADVPTPAPGAGELLVRQTVAGVNYIDVYFRDGLYPAQLPLVPGREGAGVVEAVGPDVTEFAPGDRVAYTHGGLGGYAEYNTVPARECVAVPNGIDDRSACAAMLQGMTAHYLVTDVYAVGAGTVALVHAAAGGVGNLVVQLARERGATVVATVGTPEKAAIARAAGAEHVIDYSTTDFGEEAKRLLGPRAFDVAYDGVGKATWERSMSLLRPRGMLVLFGNASGPVPPIDPLRLTSAGSLVLTRPTLVDFVRRHEERLARARDLFDAITRGRLRIRIGATYPLTEAAQAHRDLEARKTTGKLLLLP
jgi:NADPH2:quinone reductase